MNKYTIKRGVGHVRLTVAQVKQVREFYRMKGTAGDAMFFAEAEAYPQGGGWYEVHAKGEVANALHVRHAMEKMRYALLRDDKSRTVTTTTTNLTLPRRRRVIVVPAVRPNGKPIALALDRARQAALNKEAELTAMLRVEERRQRAMSGLLARFGKPEQRRFS